MVLPSQGPPPTPDAGFGAPVAPPVPDNAALVATLPPELVAQIDPAVINQLLDALTPQEREEFAVVPLPAKEDLLLVAAERLGLLEPEPPPAAIPPAAPPLAGAGGLPADAPAPPLDAGPMGPDAGGGGSMPPGMPPEAMLAAQAMGAGLSPANPQPQPQSAIRNPQSKEPQLPKAPPPPPDWEPEAIADLRRASPWRTPIDVEELIRLADDCLKDSFWTGRNDACYDQDFCYYRSREWTKLDGKKVNPLAGDLLYMLSTPARTVDDMVSRCRPDPDTLVWSLKTRSERKEFRLSAQAVENWIRSQWEEHGRRWWDEAARRRPDADLGRKLALLDLLHGTVGWGLRPDLRRRQKSGRDLNADYPFRLEVIPQHELFTLGDLTIRIQAITLAEARRMDARIREKWKSRPQAGFPHDDGSWYPGDDHQCRLISVSDADGLWFGRAFDLWPEAQHRASYEPMWLDEPKPIDFGFCAYQLPPGWQSTGDNALPDRRQPAEDYGRQFARGMLFSSLEDFRVQDKMASAALSTFLYNRNPASVDIVDVEARKRLELDKPPEFEREMGKKNTRLKDEDHRFLFKNFGDLPGDQFMLSLSFGQTSEAFPAQLTGGGQSASGYDRRQQVEAAQTRVVTEARRHVARVAESIGRHKVELAYRYGGGDAKAKRYFQGLPFRQATGGVGEGTLTIEDIRRAGNGITCEYHQEDLERDLRLNAVWIPRLKEGVAARLTSREEMGFREPEREEERIAEEGAMTHPAMIEAETEYAMVKRANPLLPFFQAAMERQRLQREAQESGQFPTQAGAPPGGLPPAEMGVPPGMPLPNGVGG